MFSQKQLARLQIANKLHEARNLVLDCKSSIIWDNGQHADIVKISGEIDILLAQLIPNENADKE